MEKVVGSIMCGGQTVHVAVGAFGLTSDALPPDQAEGVVVNENLLQSSPPMLIGMEETKEDK